MQEQPPQPDPPASQFAAQPPQPGGFQPARVERQSNVLGLVGFILSIIGLVLGWCLWPIALLSLIAVILCGIALLKPPRGLAIAGLIIGLIGCVVLAVLVFVIGAIAVAAPEIEATTDTAMLRMLVDEHQRTNGSWPATIDDLAMVNSGAKTDHWDNAYRVEIDQQTGAITLQSSGADGLFDTEDDIQIVQ